MTGDPRNEAELCELFSEAARADGWDVYPEVEGWDLLLVWRDGVPATWRGHRASPSVPTGYQMGVEAKMRANVDVLAQAAARMTAARRPDAGAVLVPNSGQGFTAFVALAHKLDLRAFDLANCADHATRHGYHRDRLKIEPTWPWGRFAATERTGPLTLPPIPLQSAGGQASPRTMSKWRVGALRLVLALEGRGHLTNADFKAHGIDKRLWLDRKWLIREGTGAATRYLPGPQLRNGNGPVSGYQAELEALRAHDAKEVA